MTTKPPAPSCKVPPEDMILQRRKALFAKADLLILLGDVEPAGYDAGTYSVRYDYPSDPKAGVWRDLFVADAIVRQIEAGKRVVVRTWSEAIVLRVLRRVREGRIDHERVLLASPGDWTYRVNKEGELADPLVGEAKVWWDWRMAELY